MQQLALAGGNERSGLIEYGSGGVPFLDVMQSGGTCTMQTSEVKTVNLGGGIGSYSTAYSYGCPRNTFQSINGGYAPLNDAHNFAMVTNAMYKSYVGTTPLSGMFILRVHYDYGYENAFGMEPILTLVMGINIFIHYRHH